MCELVSTAQTHLSEELQILHEFNYSDLDMPYQFTDVRTPETNPDIRVLDLIAVCLSTGDPGDIVAAAFEKREYINLILAKKMGRSLTHCCGL